MGSDTERYICIHGHFYQPPRENAWLEQVEWQDSAYPYHDWNEKVTAECYLPNASSRILNGEGFISRIVSNYARISFNFGPTLLAWMETGNPEVYQAIIEADKQSRGHYSGHGSALAQAYNHLIMPLANHRDRYSQVLWGIRDFEHRFGRRPEGMWLPETAVDLATLDVMAELGLSFTVLAPHQAKREREVGTSNWKDAGGGAIDTTRDYLVNLSSGRRIGVFFYDGAIASSVSFGDLLKSGDKFVERLSGAFSDKRNHPQLVHIATDGETYGHHHRFGDMALAYALQHIEENNLARLTNYGEFLEKNPPTREVEIVEKTSWSCVHGIDRWWSDCGDRTGSGDHPDWNQKWRTPLRNAFDWLRDTVSGPYEEKARQLLKDPWAARDGYIDVILDRSRESLNKFFSEYASHPLSEEERITALQLLELQRHAMLMYTSCGWYFDELSRPEPVQVIQYAGRVVQLAGELFGKGVEEDFLKILEQAKSNIPEQGDGRRIYENLVKPAIIDLTKVAAHYAVSSLFEKYSRKNEIYCYSVENEDYNTTDCGKARLATGRSRVTSEITGESAVFSFGVFHFGDHIINAGVSGYQGEKEYRDMGQDLARTCAAADFTGVIRRLDKHFGNSTYSLKSLFRDEQHKVLGYILESTMTDIEKAYRQLYEHHYPPMRFLSELGGPVPRAFHSAAELIINIDLHRAINGDELHINTVRNLLDTAATWQVDLDADGIGYDFKVNLEKKMGGLLAKPDDIENLEKMADMVSLARSMPFPVDLWKVQNLFWDMMQTVSLKYWQEAENNDENASAWVKAFVRLGKNLSIRVK
jgi:alpha-amylase/alpha-mannosidase (GH57 family)